MNIDTINKFNFSSHICINTTKNVIETIEMILDRLEPSINQRFLSQTLSSEFNNIDIEVKDNGDITISGLKDKSDLQKPFLETISHDTEVDMNIFQNKKYDFLVEYTTENKQLVHYMTLEELLQTDDAKNILSIYDVGIVNDLTLLAWRV